MGLALLPCYLADGQEALVRVLPPARVVVRGLWLVVHRDLRHLARARALFDFLVQQLEAHRRTLQGQR